MQPERRYFEADDLEIRADVGEDGAPRVSGYFARYNAMSPTYGKMREKIAPGFFDEALGRDDVKALFNHDTSRLLGRSKAGTLQLHSDGNGLFGTISPIPDTPTGKEVTENLRLRNLSGASFAFTLAAENGDTWAKASDGVWERTLLRVGQLFDVSVVTEPFYPQTDVGLREMRSQLDESFKRWAEAHPEEVNPPVELDKPTEMDEARLRLAAL